MNSNAPDAQSSDRERLLSHGRTFIHDANNRLAVILGSLDLAVDDPLLPIELRPQLERAIGDALRMAQDIKGYQLFLRSFDEDRF